MCKRIGKHRSATRVRIVCRHRDSRGTGVQSIRANVPEGEHKIVYDKYHVAAHLGHAVDLVRRQENRQLRHRGDDRLVGSKYDWLTNPANFTRSDWLAFSQLRNSDLRTARAWALKESGMRLFDYR